MSIPRRARVAAVLGAAVFVLAFPDAASAHALVGGRARPVPAWLFAWGASLVLIVSFALLSVAWQEARLQREGWRPIWPRLSAVLLSPATQLLCGLIGVGLLGLVLYAGFRG